MFVLKNSKDCVSSFLYFQRLFLILFILGGGLAKVCSNFKEVLVHVSKFLCTVRLGG